MTIDRIVYIDNAAVEGARLALLSSDMRRRAVQLALRISRVQVAETPDFQMRFADAMLFPPVFENANSIV